MGINDFTVGTVPNLSGLMEMFNFVRPSQPKLYVLILLWDTYTYVDLQNCHILRAIYAVNFCFEIT